MEDVTEKNRDTHVDSISRSFAPAVSCMFFRCQFRSWMFFLEEKIHFFVLVSCLFLVFGFWFFCLISLKFVVSAA